MGERVTMEDRERAIELVEDLKTKVSDVITHVQQQINKLTDGQWNTAKGVSFLEVKYHMLLSYLINLTQILCMKVKGQSIQGDPSIDRLVEIRTVLEKMRPIDQKLQYQVDKLLKTATTGTLGQNDPLRLKPNPDNLQSKFEEESDASEEEEEEKEQASSSNVYRPPKLAAVFYDGDDTVKEREEKHVERAKKKALSSSIIRDLQAEYYDGPEEIRESGDLHRMKADKAGKERTEYEEKYLLRTAIPKRERFAAKKLRTGLNDLTSFGDISALTEEGPSMEEGVPTKKRKKMSGKKKGKVSKKFKRRK